MSEEGKAMRPNLATISKAAANVLLWDVSAAAKALSASDPAAWTRMQVRSIQALGNYYSSKIVQVALTAAIHETKVQAEQRAQFESNIGAAASILEKHDFPLYYASAPLIEALKHSHPPQMTWEDITLPFPGLCFMVPRGSIIEPEPTKSEIACLGIVKLGADVRYQIPTTSEFVLNKSRDRFCVFWFLGPGGLETNDITFVTTQPLEPEIHWITEATGTRPYHGPPNSFASAMAGLVANLILVMEARKELVEPCYHIHSKKPRRSDPEVYVPTYIGRNYTILREQRESSERQSHYTELGWRAGHFKRQHFGPRWEQVKTIFVDPYIAFTRGLKPVAPTPETQNAGGGAS